MGNHMKEHLFNPNIEAVAVEEAVSLYEAFSQNIEVMEEQEEENPIKVVFDIDAYDDSQLEIDTHIAMPWGEFVCSYILDIKRNLILSTEMHIFFFTDTFTYCLDTGVLVNSFGVRLSEELFTFMPSLKSVARKIGSAISGSLNDPFFQSLCES